VYQVAQIKAKENSKTPLLTRNTSLNWFQGRRQKIFQGGGGGNGKNKTEK